MMESRRQGLGIRLGLAAVLACVFTFSLAGIAAAADTYRFELKWGTPGTGNSQFNQPLGIAVTFNQDQSSERVYVADTGNNRIQKFSVKPTRTVFIKSKRTAKNKSRRAKRVKRFATIFYTTTKDATVTFKIEKRTQGRKIGRKCRYFKRVPKKFLRKKRCIVQDQIALPTPQPASPRSFLRKKRCIVQDQIALPTPQPASPRSFLRKKRCIRFKTTQRYAKRSTKGVTHDRRFPFRTTPRLRPGIYRVEAFAVSDTGQRSAVRRVKFRTVRIVKFKQR